MAAALPAEASCPECRGLFQDPVSIHCGHSFCRGCITRRWGANGRPFPCPRCHQTAPEKTLRPNRELAKVIEVAKRLSLRAAPGRGARCPRHGEVLKLFCEDDRTLICLACRGAPEHRAHAVVPIEEAAEENKEKFEAHVRILKDQREKLLGLKEAEEGKSRKCLDRVESERQKLASQFGALRRLLDARERLLLERLGQLGREVARREEEKVNGILGDVAAIDGRIRELEERCRQPPCEFLRDIGAILSRIEEDGAPKPTEPSEPQGPPTAIFPATHVVLKEEALGFRASVTLDPDTAHPRLVLSADFKEVKFGDTRRPVPDTPQRFDSSRCVLARHGLTAGRRYWEVDVGHGDAWAVGVAKASVARKGRLRVKPDAGIWALGRCGPRYQAMASPAVPLSVAPRKVGVFVDYDGGRVAFFDAAQETPIFVFFPLNFEGEEILPLLCLGRGGRLVVSP
ncbi:E3 ubiquitin-protein ligase TRIM7-like [Patagioenas fasciata]|uniref:E3 ubiquitin-protein ligase TRIM7-like n=1 Tax=Patagioenas fasciata TaxID=372321 RepID=UPI0032E90274